MGPVPTTKSVTNSPKAAAQIRQDSIGKAAKWQGYQREKVGPAPWVVGDQPKIKVKCASGFAFGVRNKQPRACAWCSIGGRQKQREGASALSEPKNWENLLNRLLTGAAQRVKLLNQLTRLDDHVVWWSLCSAEVR
jgi:hypothetical protein